LAINAALAVVAALTLFPLAWMFFGFVDAPGETSVFPPPLLPRSVTLANYRETFATAGSGRADRQQRPYRGRAQPCLDSARSFH